MEILLVIQYVYLIISCHDGFRDNTDLPSIPRQFPKANFRPIYISTNASRQGENFQAIFESVFTQSGAINSNVNVT